MDTDIEQSEIVRGVGGGGVGWGERSVCVLGLKRERKSPIGRPGRKWE
jgi:hypothetical protein